LERKDRVFATDQLNVRLSATINEVAALIETPALYLLTRSSSRAKKKLPNDGQLLKRDTKFI
jgi:hypothetical protein